MNSDKNGGLKIKTFGNTDIIYNGKSILYEKQLTPRVRSLLQYFIINKNKWCKPDTIIADLWPDNEYIDEKKVLRTYIYRLRNILTKDNEFKKDFSQQINILNTNGNYQMSISDDTEIDTEIFQRLTEQAAAIHTYKELIDVSENLKNVYAGHFMSDSAKDHVIERLQNNYRSIYCTIMVDMLTKLNDLEQYHDIISICESFFQIDDLDNTINCIFMKALIETGQVNYASRHYNYVVKKMREVLSIEPSPEMTALYRNIKMAGGEDGYGENDLMPLNMSFIRNMVEEIVTERMDSKKAIYSVLKLEILNNTTEIENPFELLEMIMLASLRRRDIYAVLNKSTAVAMLYEATDKSYDLIKERVIEAFHKIYPQKNDKVDIVISPALYIT